jgi:eukaryotic-like serine/threonine-protein kinase
MDMNATRKKFEGQIADGKFVLLEYLGGSELSFVYRTERVLPASAPAPGASAPAAVPGRDKAAIKFVAAKAGSAESQLTRWRQAEKLSHPNLVKIFESGQCRLRDEDFIYVVQELADEDLSQILPQRALTQEETRAMLAPALDALAYLHGKGFVHAHLRPSNIMALGNEVKLSADGVVKAGERTGELGRLSPYDPPEASSGRLSTAADMWSLGMTLAEVLTQRLPIWERLGQEEPRAPEAVPRPFAEIVGRCLLRDPRSRWKVESVAERMQHKLVKYPEAPAPKVMRAAAAAQPAVAAAPQPIEKPSLASQNPVRPAASKPVAPQPTTRPSSTLPQTRPAGTNLALAAGAIVLLVIGILEVPRLLKHDPDARPVETASTEAAASSSHSAPSSAAAGESAVNSAAPSIETPHAKLEGPKPAPAAKKPPQHPVPPPVAAAPESAQPIAVKSTSGVSSDAASAGEITHQAIPDVPQKSLGTIHGTLRVAVRVNVDESGKVSAASFDAPGPSQYFARIAMKSAQQWTFSPASPGQAAPREWILHYQFTSGGTKVIPAPAAGK